LVVVAVRAVVWRDQQVVPVVVRMRLSMAMQVLTDKVIAVAGVLKPMRALVCPPDGAAAVVVVLVA
jgi:hypothetical protein